MASTSPAAAIGPQGECVWPISAVESTRRREEKNYRLSHRDVSGGLRGIVIKPTRQASAIGLVYRRPSLLVGGRHEHSEPLARWYSVVVVGVNSFVQFLPSMQSVESVASSFCFLN